MNKFKSYYGLSNQKENTINEKWETVLFTGDFSPITRDESERINQFITKVVNNESHRDKFESDVDVGIIIDYRDHPDQIAEDKVNHELSLSEKAYIATKFFGLKVFPINLTEMLWFTHSVNHEKDLTESKGLISEFQKFFHNTNVLIVLRPEEKMFMNEFEEMKPFFKDKHLNIGFMIFEHEPVIPDDFLKKIPCDSKILKSLALLDYEKPEPHGLKQFAYKYGLSEYLDYIKTLHLKCKGEKYDLAFQSLFPTLRLTEDDDNITLESNAKVALNVLKSMYIKNLE